VGRVVDRAEARRLCADAAERGQRVVFTNGCFDLLHHGHASILASARGLGDLLVVGVNDDDSVRRLKGAGRPLVPLESRAGLLAALAAVDVVVPFAEDTPLETIRALRPVVLVKGADYEGEEVVGAAEVRAWGGELHLLPRVPGQSTTELARRIRRSEGE
jgi:D-beta-D-heptose 7-phosphate kinase/D-beta-D-heptose 1-phosphate adenosyltransferase